MESYAGISLGTVLFRAMTYTASSPTIGPPNGSSAVSLKAYLANSGGTFRSAGPVSASNGAETFTVRLLVPLPQGGRSTVTTTAVDERGRRSATSLGVGNVEISAMR